MSSFRFWNSNLQMKAHVEIQLQISHELWWCQRVGSWNSSLLPICWVDTSVLLCILKIVSSRYWIAGHFPQCHDLFSKLKPAFHTYMCHNLTHVAPYKTRQTESGSNRPPGLAQSDNRCTAGSLVLKQCKIINDCLLDQHCWYIRFRLCLSILVI